MPGRPKKYRTPEWSSLYKSLDLLTGGKLVDILRYERSVGTSDRKIAKVLAEQYGVSLSQVTVKHWCDYLKIPSPPYVKHSRWKRIDPPPLPPEALTDQLPPLPPEALTERLTDTTGD